MKLVVGLLAWGALLRGQSVQVYSEFQRVDPFGVLLEQDRSPAPREIISPAVARNAFTTFRVVVTAAPGSTYFLFVGANPPGIVETRLYKEDGQEALELVREPGFGAIPGGQTSRSYLLDVWTPARVEPGRRVRIELQLKTGGWLVYPIELRVQDTVLPEIQAGPPVWGADIARRNAEQDLRLAERAGQEAWLLLFRQTVPVWMGMGPEWVLRFRDLIYRGR